MTDSEIKEDEAPYGHDQWIGSVLRDCQKEGRKLKKEDLDDPEILHEALRRACRMLRNLMDKK